MHVAATVAVVRENVKCGEEKSVEFDGSFQGFARILIES
jgi:hypothetical protein